jgi:hypothetical protein
MGTKLYKFRAGAATGVKHLLVVLSRRLEDVSQHEMKLQT